VLKRWCAAFLTPKILNAIEAFPAYLVEWGAYKKAAHRERVGFWDLYPCLTDRVVATPFDPHYFFQAAWLARRLGDLSPAWHVDIGSSALMINVLSAGVKTIFVDYRPLRVKLSNLCSLAGDVIQLPFQDGSIGSLSCLHVIEHVGLGRYGDPLDPAGSRRAADDLTRVVKPGGRLFLSAPVGQERVCFNAHRVHAPRSIAALFPNLRLHSFSFVDDDGRFSEQAELHSADGLEYGCGMFEFVKERE
jgi:SAM-dependent methyltransferase